MKVNYVVKSTILIPSSLVTSGSDGRVVSWNLLDGTAATIEGDGHNCQVLNR